MWLTLTSRDNKKRYVNMNIVACIREGKGGAELVLSSDTEAKAPLLVRESSAEVADRLNRNGIRVG